MKKDIKDVYFWTGVDLAMHFILTAFLAGIFYMYTRNFLWPVLAVFGGVLIDIDHFVDYFMYYGPHFSTKDFFSHGYLESGKSFVFFHSVELAVFLIVISIWARWITPFAAGMTLHLLIDCLVSHRSDPVTLFLIYRWKKGFIYSKK